MKETLNTSILSAGLIALEDSMKSGQEYLGINNNDLLEANMQLEELKNRNIYIKQRNNQNEHVSCIVDLKWIYNVICSQFKIRVDDFAFTDTSAHSMASKPMSYEQTANVYNKKSKSTKPLRTCSINVLFKDILSSQHPKDNINDFVRKLIKLVYFEGGKRKDLFTNTQLETLFKELIELAKERDSRVRVEQNKVIPIIKELFLNTL